MPDSLPISFLTGPGLPSCEARLFQFTGPAHGDGEPTVKQVAACDLHEAITYLRKWHPNLDVFRVEFVRPHKQVSDESFALFPTGLIANAAQPFSSPQPLRPQFIRPEFRNHYLLLVGSG